jgi:hypothetical protein
VTKYRSREQTETAQERAVRFANDVLQDSDLSDELALLSPEEYASRKGIVITNPERRTTNVANGNGTITKSDLQDMCDQVENILSAVYTPESSRADLVDAVSSALDVLAGDTADDEEPGDDTDDDDSDLD